MTRERLPQTRRSCVTNLRLLHDEGQMDIYVTVGFYRDGRVGEVFCQAGHCGSRTSGWLDLTMTMASIALQCGAPYRQVLGKMLGQRFAPDGRLLDAPECMRDSQSPHVNVSSPADAVARYMLARWPEGREVAA